MKNTKERKFRFETLQVHAGQELPDPATGAKPYLFIRPHPTFSMTVQKLPAFDLSQSETSHAHYNPTDIFEENGSPGGGVAALAVASGSAAITYAIQKLPMPRPHRFRKYSLEEPTTSCNTLKISASRQLCKPDERTALKCHPSQHEAIFIESLGNQFSIIDIKNWQNSP